MILKFTSFIIKSIMHHIYTTKAIIVKSLPSGEANKFYFILTKDLGFIRASAQGVRLDKSKLKGHLQEFSLLSLSVVKGREIWRITNAETMHQPDFLKNLDELRIVKNIFSLLSRLLQGEEKNEALFDCIDSFYNFLSKNELTKDQLKNLEVIIVLRILHALGYFKKSLNLSDFLKDDSISTILIDNIKEKRNFAINEINEALEHTNL